jgi:hypothetical protein
MKALVCAALVTVGSVAPSSPILRHWAVSTEAVETDFPRVVFTLIGSAASRKLPILILSYRDESWNALLTCGEPLEGPAAKLSIAWDGQNEQTVWRMTRDGGAAFTSEAEAFILRLIGSQNLEVEFPVAGQCRRAAFDVTGLAKEIDNFPQAKKALVPDKLKRRAPRPATVIALSVSEVSK